MYHRQKKKNKRDKIKLLPHKVHTLTWQ